jgi:hypothetical protein
MHEDLRRMTNKGFVIQNNKTHRKSV